MNNQHIFSKFLPKKLQNIEKTINYAPANIALTKYWGKRDSILNLPENDSISISLGDLGSKTKIELSNNDKIIFNGQNIDNNSVFAKKIWQIVNIIRQNNHIFLKITSQNSIPTAAGLASSASGFAALALALNNFFQLNLPQSKLSILARLGSGSACRSIWHGFVEWQKGKQDDGTDCFAKPIPLIWKDFRIALLEVDTSTKKISSRSAMDLCKKTSPFYAEWIKQTEKDKANLLIALHNKNFTRLGEIAENNALLMHSTIISSRPSINYLQGKSIDLINKIQYLRENGLEIYLTIDAGPNIKLLYLAKDFDQINQNFPNAIHISPFDYLTQQKTA